MLALAGQNPATTLQSPSSAPTSQPSDVTGLTGLAITEGATQTGVNTSAHPSTWVGVKKADANIVFEATIAGPYDGIVQWTGAQAMPSDNRKATLSRAQTNHVAVKAKAGDKEKTLDVWVMWATIEIKMTGQTPDFARPFGTVLYDKTENLGLRTYLLADQTTALVGKVVPIATLNPVGIGDVLSCNRVDSIGHPAADALEFLRKRQSRVFVDGQVFTGTNGSTRGDTWAGRLHRPRKNRTSTRGTSTRYMIATLQVYRRFRARRPRLRLTTTSGNTSRSMGSSAAMTRCGISEARGFATAHRKFRIKTLEWAELICQDRRILTILPFSHSSGYSRGTCDHT